MFHPPILNMDRFITTFWSILASITEFFTNCSSITPLWTNSSSIKVFWTNSSYITIFWLHQSKSSDKFSKFSSRERWDMPTAQPFHLIHFSRDIRHLLLAPLQHFSDVTTLLSILLAECIQRRNLYVVISMTWLLHKYGPWPTLCLTTRKIFQNNKWIGRCWCARNVFKSYVLPQFVRLFFTCWLWFSIANLDVFHSILFVLVLYVWCNRQMRPHVEPSPAHHLHSRVPLAHPLLALSHRFCPFMYPSLLLPSKFSQWSVRLALGIHPYVAYPRQLPKRPWASMFLT